MSARGLWSSHMFTWAVQTHFQKPQSPETFFPLQGNVLLKPGREKATSEIKQVSHEPWAKSMHKYPCWIHQHMQGFGRVVVCTGEGKKMGKHEVQALNLEGSNKDKEANKRIGDKGSDRSLKRLFRRENSKIKNKIKWGNLLLNVDWGVSLTQKAGCGIDPS